MKNNILKLTLFVSAFIFIGCEKDVPVVSKVVQEVFPTIVLKGSDLVVVPAGQTFTDPGATVMPGYNSAGAIDTTSAANVSIMADSVKLGTAEGIYFVPYTYRNVNGFETTVKRKVVVVNQAYTSNYAGKWKRNTNGVIANWTNLGSGVHAISDPGGANLPTDILYIIIKNDNTVIVPEQTTAGNNAIITGLNSISFTPTQVKYAFRAGNGVYGTAVRTFDKQP
jgi:Domain of unknown function (DUF5011)